MGRAQTHDAQHCGSPVAAHAFKQILARRASSQDEEPDGNRQENDGLPTRHGVRPLGCRRRRALLSFASVVGERSLVTTCRCSARGRIRR